jgi:hypothetical protein
MTVADPLTLAVRERATWCDLVCRLHRFAPEGDARVWWSARRTPDLIPDAISLVADLTAVDVLGRVFDAPGASVEDSFATLDLTDQGWTVRADATWVTRPPGVGADAEVASTFSVVRERIPFAAWCWATGAPEGALPSGLRRASGVTVLGRAGDAGFVDGAIVHRTTIGGTSVVGVWNQFGAWADVVAAASSRYPKAWIVGWREVADLDPALAAGFSAVGPLRVWHRPSTPV